MLTVSTRNALVILARTITDSGQENLLRSRVRDFLESYAVHASKSADPMEREMGVEIQENIEEAVQVIGGVLGMM